MSVIVEDLSDQGPRRLGLTQDQIRTDTELKLRLAGMRVLSETEIAKVAGMPSIYIQINLSDDAQAASIEIELQQNAMLERNGELAIAVPTWRIGTLVENPTRDGIRGYTKDLLDKFLNAWLSVNPRK